MGPHGDTYSSRVKGCMKGEKTILIKGEAWKRSSLPEQILSVSISFLNKEVGTLIELSSTVKHLCSTKLKNLTQF